ncbi:SagB family peptide dehydrogenase [Streptomyces sp. NBC_01217]|uniref:SagB family peptide dehydrogenase n=1 Tax=Streptomyces sp. NBC_01217 TaxID=2903779 RepID=UPI002E0D42F3|nr:SagB family peptide dehydrogenase [Streptomyces sp. NBC_01217]
MSGQEYGGPPVREVFRVRPGPAVPDGTRAEGRSGPEPGGKPRGAVERLWAAGRLSMTVHLDDKVPLYTLLPHTRPPKRPDTAPPDGLVLSRFAVIRRGRGGLVIESPRAWCDVRLRDPALLGALTGAGETSPGHLPDAAADRVGRDLWWAGLAVPATDDAEEREPELRQWAPHELWFHSRTRMSGRRAGGGFGRTDWAQGVFGPLPAQHPPFPGPGIDLHRPDLGRLRSTDPSLTAVLETRRTIRTHDDTSPLTAEQLGEFLFRCCRNRWKAELRGVEYVSRPYPAGGSGYELELYPVVRNVAGIAPALYHYDPQGHRLERVCGRTPEVRRLLALAATLADQEQQPQTLLVVAARFGRLMRSYEGMPYALIMKHTGVLFQTMYTVATAMGLAPCALGTGDSGAFARATGLDPYTEASVGEFMLGSRPTTRSM